MSNCACMRHVLEEEKDKALAIEMDQVSLTVFLLDGFTTGAEYKRNDESSLKLHCIYKYKAISYKTFFYMNHVQNF